MNEPSTISSPYPSIMNHPTLLGSTGAPTVAQVNGSYADDTLCLGDPNRLSCARMRWVAAWQLSEEPFGQAAELTATRGFVINQWWLVVVYNR